MLKEGPVASNAAAPDIPDTIDEALNPQWLTRALAPVSGGARVTHVELTEVIKTMASKARFAVRFEGDDRLHSYCLKAFMGEDQEFGGATTIREGDFYLEIAPHITMRVPQCANVILDREGSRGLLVMEDLVVAGAHFCGALEPCTPDLAAQMLDQLARLHAASHLVPRLDWLPDRVEQLGARPMFDEALQQSLLDDERSAPLDARTRSAALLHASLKALAERYRGRPHTLLHGDTHAGNIYLTAEGPGFTDWQLIQRGHWSLDVSYMINGALPVDVAEREERRLLDHYIDALAAHDGETLDRAQAWEDYRTGIVIGFYNWAVTRRVVRPIINEFTKRLGLAMERLETYKALGL